MLDKKGWNVDDGLEDVDVGHIIQVNFGSVALISLDERDHSTIVWD